MDITKIYYCRECKASHHRQIKNLKNAFLENPSNIPRDLNARSLGILEDYAFKNKIKKPENQGTLARMAVEKEKLWKTGRVLTVTYIGGNKLVKERIKEYANEWSEHANVFFDFDHRQKRGDIRISFRKTGGSWSEVGTDLLSVPKSEPTMNFGWLEPELNEEEFRQVVLHEFGHTLGCVHEHSRPDNGIPWNVPKVYVYYKKSDDWDKEDVDDQVFFKYDRDILRASRIDKDSIMMYAIPEELTIGRYSVGFNSELSPKDKTYIRKLYPKK